MARPEHYRAECALCGGIFTARDLDKIYVRRGTYGRLLTLATVCNNCTARVADFLGRELPDLDAPVNRRNLHNYCPECFTIVSKFDIFCKTCGKQLKGGERHD